MAYINNNKIKGLGGIKRAYLNNTLIFQSFKKNEEVISPYDITATFDVTSTTSPTQICYSSRTSAFTEMYVDGVQIDVSSGYTFNITGEHTVQYMLADKKTIINWSFNRCYSLTSIVIPDSVTSIGDYAFIYCSGLTSVTIGSGVTSIGKYALYDCRSLNSITCYATNAPTLGTDVFYKLQTNGTLYVPQGSDYSTWKAILTTWTIQYLT